MKKYLLITLSFFMYQPYLVAEHNELPADKYDQLFEKKDEQLKFLQKSLERNESTETGLTKTNIGIALMFGGIGIIMAGAYKNLPSVTCGGVLISVAGGGTAYFATHSRRKSEEQSREAVSRAMTEYNDLRVRIKILKD